jgi:hypothetical protein
MGVNKQKKQHIAVLLFVAPSEFKSNYLLEDLERLADIAA